MELEKRFLVSRFVKGITTLLVAFLAAVTAVTAVQGQEVIELGEIAVIGSRFGERSVADSAVPVDVVSGEELLATGQSELGKAIQEAVPSFNFSNSSISDGTDSVRPATLRGLGPDQVLVLVNGKRRHGSALIHVNTSVGRGTAGTDMNAIPISAIERVEVLRDGASAQYGSDAVAGVINIVLREDYEGALKVLSGSTYQGDGDRRSVGIHKGFALGNDGAVHLSLEYNERDRTNRAGKSGVIQYPDTVATKVGGVTTITADPGNKERDFDRRKYRIGDAEQEHTVGAINMSLPVWDDLGELYGFANFSHSTNLSGGFYRRANEAPQKNPVGSVYPDGFLPLIDTTVDDYSVGVGVHRKYMNGLTAELSVVHGGNTFEFDIRNSQNASWVNCMLDPTANCPGNFPGVNFSGATQTSADAGELSLDLTTVNLDFTMPYKMAEIAWGAEYKRDRYEIDAGEPYSYEDYDGPGGGNAGIQVFPGFKPQNEVDETRNAKSVYIDTDIQLTERLQVALGLRHEDYSDFGDTLNGKIASKLELSNTLSLRGSVSSGFRAPSMQQLYFNNISTQFRTCPSGTGTCSSEVGTFRNDSALAQAIGIPELEEEESVNFSGGFVYQPSSTFSLTTDFYRIEVDDRIIISGQLAVPDPGDLTDLSAAVIASLISEGVNSAQFFMNGVDTVTEGADIVMTWDIPMDKKGDLKLQLLGSWTETEIDSVNLPAGLPESLFTELDRSIIEEWQPKSRIALSAMYRVGKLAAAASVQRYGRYRITEGAEKQSYNPEFITDVELSYELGPGVFKLGADNVFDVKPDRDKISGTRAGKIVDAAGNLVVDSDGVFSYSRRSAPFGFNGGVYYTSYEYKF